MFFSFLGNWSGQIISVQGGNLMILRQIGFFTMNLRNERIKQS